MASGPPEEQLDVACFLIRTAQLFSSHSFRLKGFQCPPCINIRNRTTPISDDIAWESEEEEENLNTSHIFWWKTRNFFDCLASMPSFRQSRQKSLFSLMTGDSDGETALESGPVSVLLTGRVTGSTDHRSLLRRLEFSRRGRRQLRAARCGSQHNGRPSVTSRGPASVTPRDGRSPTINFRWQPPFGLMIINWILRLTIVFATAVGRSRHWFPDVWPVLTTVSVWTVSSRESAFPWPR